MTCIVGIKHRDGVLLAADSAGSNSNNVFKRKDSKLYRVGEFGIGFTTSFRMGQLLGYGFKPSNPPSKGDLMPFMVETFIEEVRKRLKDGGFASAESGEESGGNFLVAVRGHLYEIGDDYQVGETIDHFNSVGSGLEFALGSMLTSTPPEGDLQTYKQARDRASKALQAASRWCVSVCSPFDYLNVEYKE